MIALIAWSIGIVMGLFIGAGVAVEYLNRRTVNYASPLPRATIADFRRRERANKRALRREIQRMRTVQ